MPTKTWRNLDDAKRARVFHAAQMEFGLRGFQAGSLNVIAKEAHVSKGSLFQYFDDKLDLWKTVCEMGVAEVNGYLLPRVPDIRSIPLFDWLHVAMDVFITFYLENERNRLGATAVWLEMDPRARRVAQRIVHESFAAVLLPAIIQAREVGDVREDLPAEMLLSDIERLSRLMEWAPFLPEADPVFDLTKRGPEEIRRMAHAQIDLLRRAWAPLEDTGETTATALE